MSTPLPSIAADVEQRLKALEVELEAEKTKLSTKVKAVVGKNFPHAVTWAGIGYIIFRHFL